MAALARIGPIQVVKAARKHTASLIFLHGSGDTGQGVRFWLADILEQEFSFPHVRVIYPTAPQRPYTPFNGLPSSVWFDRKQISSFVPEDNDSMDEISLSLDALIEQEVERGIPRDRIVLGGFSMGGALAMYYGYQKGQGLGGVFALSAFLNKGSRVYESVKQASGPLPPLFQAHGGSDSLVPMAWGKTTSQELTALGVATQFHEYPNIVHQMCEDEVEKLQEWIVQTIPDT